MKTKLLRTLAAGALVATAHAQLAISGRPVPNLNQLDTIMSNFMTDANRTIPAGVLGVSRGGRVIFLHAYGTLVAGTNLPETALFRQASVVKPVTAAAIQQFSATNGLGATQLQRRAFNLAGNGGVLNVAPAGTPDGNAQNITVGHLLNHSAGWDRNQPNPGDIPINRVRTAGIAMNNPDALPTRPQLIDWALQFALNFAPGAATYTPPGGTAVVPGPGPTYSNFGYLVLGEILQASAPGGYLGYVGSQILSPGNWIPATDWGAATTLRAQNHPREPLYENTEGNFSSVFDYTAPIDQLPATYGGLIASAQAMLRFGSLYRVAYATQGAGATQSNTLGVAVAATGFPDGSDAMHTGSLPGTSTSLRQVGLSAGAADDLVIYIAFNERSGGAADWAQEASNEVFTHLLGIAVADTWPAETCDGYWVTLGGENGTAGFGGYHSNYLGLPALDPDGDGASNNFEFTAGLAPTDPASTFRLSIAPVPGQPSRKNIVFTPRLDGRTYTVEARPALESGIWQPLPASTQTDNGDERTVTDLNATGAKKLYRVQITRP